jgi:hypothetical protein
MDPVQNTLDAFESVDEPSVTEGVVTGGSEMMDASENARAVRQESIDIFMGESGRSETPAPTKDKPSRALEGIALEACMQRVAMTEAAVGIVRDELVITIARDCEITLERLDLIDSYVSDLELEGKLRQVGAYVVVAREGDSDLLSQDLEPEEFLELYKRRYAKGAREGPG